MSKRTKTNLPASETDRIIVFQERNTRRIWHNDEWWFAIVDVVAVLHESVQPEGCIKDLRRRDKQKANCANTEGIFRIIQPNPSAKAEGQARIFRTVGFESRRMGH